MTISFILDEPTNHLDIDSKEVLEDALIDFDGTLLFVSHDRYFINRVATKVLEISEEGSTLYLGDYDYYLEKKAELEEMERLKAEEAQEKQLPLLKKRQPMITMPKKPTKRNSANSLAALLTLKINWKTLKTRKKALTKPCLPQMMLRSWLTCKRIGCLERATRSPHVRMGRTQRTSRRVKLT